MCSFTDTDETVHSNFPAEVGGQTKQELYALRSSEEFVKDTCCRRHSMMQKRARAVKVGGALRGMVGLVSMNTGVVRKGPVQDKIAAAKPTDLESLRGHVAAKCLFNNSSFGHTIALQGSDFSSSTVWQSASPLARMEGPSHLHDD